MIGQLRMTTDGRVADKVEIAIQLLKSFEPPDGYYVAFSGGKDSQCVYHLCKMAGVKFDAHYARTSVDPPELVNFIRDNYPDVKMEAQHYDDDKPEHYYSDGTPRPITMWSLIADHTLPPTRMNGREYLSEITAQEAEELKNDGIIVAYGYSDDNVEFSGAISAEIGAFNGTDIEFFEGELLNLPCACSEDVCVSECTLVKKLLKGLKRIRADFTMNGWEFKTDIPHEEFSIMEDGELDGKGIAFYQKDIT